VTVASAGAFSPPQADPRALVASRQVTSTLDDQALIARGKVREMYDL
jgi:hypothetical protein